MKKNMEVQVLVAAMHADPKELAGRMNLSSDAVIIDQCERDGEEEFTYHNHRIRCFHYAERGVGKSRNHAIEKADRDICLFSDEDIVYRDGYAEKITGAFEKNPKADMIVFNVDVAEDRRTYLITEEKKVHFYNCGRYGAVSFAIRTDALKKSGVRFSTLFGGGAKYSNGEDSLFIKELMDKGIQVYTSPEVIGRETESESTWFSGYHDKFFFDRGVLYHFLYGNLAPLMALRFLLVHKSTLCTQKTVKEAFALMRQGMKQGRKEQGE